MATRKNILKACFVAALSVGLAACGSSTTEVVNTPPSLVLGGNAVIDEGMTGGTGLTVTATDEQGDTITYDVSDARFRVMGGMLVVVAGTMLDYETERSIAVDITASDGALSSDTKTANVMVSNVDDVPLTLSTSGTRGHIVEGKTGGTGLTFMVDDNDDMPENLRFSVHDEETDANLDEFFEVIKLGEGRYELGVKEGKELDREMDEEVQVVVTATDGHGRPEITPPLTIVVGNVDDTPPKLGMEGDTGEILEETVGNTGVYFHPTDDDGDTMLTLDILGDNRDSFDLVPVVRDRKPGYALQVKKAFDFETVGDTVEVVVAVKDSVGDIDEATFDVMVRDDNDNAPTFESGTSAAIDEEQMGRTTLQVDVDDQDMVSLGKLRVTVNDDSRFRIDDEMYLVLDQPIDRDGDMGKMSVNVELMVSDGDNTNTQTVMVTINPVNDNSPKITVDNSKQDELIEGDYLVATPTGITVLVTDEDGGPELPMVSVVDDPRFEVADDGKLMIVADSMFDYEEERSIVVNIEANDRGNPVVRETVTVTFTDDNDNIPRLKVTDQDGRAVKEVERAEGRVSEDTRTDYKVEVEDGDTHDTPRAMVLGDDRFGIDDDGYLIIKEGEEFNFENEADKTIELEITANDGRNDAAPYIITFKITDVDEPLRIEGEGIRNPIKLVMGPYGDGGNVTTLTANDPEDDPNAPIITFWDNKPRRGLEDLKDVLMWSENEQGNEYTLKILPGTSLVGIGDGTVYTGYIADNAGTSIYHVDVERVDVEDEESRKTEAFIQVAREPAQVETSPALDTYETYKIVPSEEHRSKATIEEDGDGKPGDETFVPSFDHLTNRDVVIDSDDDGSNSRLLSDSEIRRGVKRAGSGFENRSQNAVGDIAEINEDISMWYETSTVSPSDSTVSPSDLVPVPMEPMALDIVTDTRAVDLKSGLIDKVHGLAIRYRWSNSGKEYNTDVALIDGSSGMVREEYRGGEEAYAYMDHGFNSEGRPEDDGHGGRIPSATVTSMSPIRVDVIGAEALSYDVDSESVVGKRDWMSYAKFGLWSYNNSRKCSDCPDNGLRGAIAFGLNARPGDNARPEDLDDQNHRVGVWDGTTVAFWGNVNPAAESGAVSSDDLVFNDGGKAMIRVNFSTNEVVANMDVADHTFKFNGMLEKDRLGYAASIDGDGTGSIVRHASNPDLTLSTDSEGHFRAKGSLDGAFYGPSILSSTIDAKASAETAGTWQITDEPSSDDLRMIVIGAFGAGLDRDSLKNEKVMEQEE